MNDKDTKVPEIRFQGFTDAWEQRTLSEIVEHFQYGLNAAAKNFDGLNKYIRITDIDDDSRDFDESNLTSPDANFDEADNYLVKQGDILFARTGASTGKTYIHIYNDSPVYFAGFLIRARLLNSFLPEFIYQNTLTEKYNTFIKVMSQRSGQPGVNAQEYASYSLNLPSLPEQTAIGNFFRTLDDTITLHKRKLDGLKELKHGYLQQMFPKEGESMPRVRFAGVTEDWIMRKLGEIVDRVTIQSDARNLPKIEFEDIVSGEGILNKDISNKFDKRKGVVFEPNNILYGKLRPYLKNWLFANFKGVALGDFWVLNAKNTSPIFDYYLIQTEKYQEAANLSTGTKMPRADWKTVSTTTFSIPKDKFEQAAIGNFFRNLDAQISMQQQKLSQLKQLKSAYLQKMFI